MSDRDIFVAGVATLVLALILNGRSKNQKVRALFAVVGAVTVPGVGSLLIRAPLELSATEYWILSSCMQIGVCIFLACLHIKQMKRDAQSYREHFNEQTDELRAEELIGIYDDVTSSHFPYVSSLPIRFTVGHYQDQPENVRLSVGARLPAVVVRTKQGFEVVATGVDFERCLTSPDDANRMFGEFLPVPERGSREFDVSIEGQSSFIILLWGIYGLAALLGSVFLYFAIAQFWKIEPQTETFIFENNEGFIAALTLLIIVVSGAVVPIYTALAEQVREQIETFELQISNLHRATVNVADHASPLWTHFLSVSQAAISNWQLTRERVERRAHNLLFRPFFQLWDGQTLQDVTDDEIQREGDVGEIAYRSPVFPEPELAGFRTSYLGRPKLESSKRRIIDNQLFGTAHSACNEGEPLERESGGELPFSDRLQRARRLRYLGWMAQGALARVTTGHEPAFTLQPTAITCEPYALVGYRNTQQVDSGSFDVLQFLVPTSESFFVALLENSKDNPDNLNTTNKVNAIFAKEYRKRAKRHTEKWSTVLGPTLVAACDSLDLNLEPLVDDVILLDHLAVEKDEYEDGTLARFFFYGHWLNALTNADSRISQLLTILEPALVLDRSEMQRKVSDANDVREKLMALSQRVAKFVRSDMPGSDPIFSGVLLQLPRGWLLDVLVRHLCFSNKWLSAVQRLGQGELNEKQREFLRWTVRVLGTPEDRSNLGKVADEELRSFALGLIDPLTGYGQAIEPWQDAEHPHITEATFESLFQGVLQRFEEHCQNPLNDTELMDDFFGRDGKGTQEAQARIQLDKWRKNRVRVPQARSSDDSDAPNLTKEFLLLTLADHKSALFNWMRAARAFRVRERVTDFQQALTRQRARSKRQLGIEVIPSRHDRLEHLRTYLGYVGYRKPLQVRSIYDLQPTSFERSKPVNEETREKRAKQKNRKRVYAPYSRIVTTLRVSNSWEKAVAIDTDTQDWAYQYMFEGNIGEMPNVARRSRLTLFLSWILRVLDPDQDLEALENADPEHLVLQALRRVNPRLRPRSEQDQQQENQLPDLTEEEYETQLGEIIERILNYCRNRENAQDLQVTFFNLGNRGQERQARLNYEDWYNRLFQM